MRPPIQAMSEPGRIGTWRSAVAEVRLPTDLWTEGGVSELNLMQLEGQARASTRAIAARLRDMGRLQHWVAGGISATVKVARGVQREKRFPLATSLKVVRRWRQLTAEELRTSRRHVEKGTLAASSNTSCRPNSRPACSSAIARPVNARLSQSRV